MIDVLGDVGYDGYDELLMKRRPARAAVSLIFRRGRKREGRAVLKTLELEFAAAVTQSQVLEDRQNGI